MDRRAVLTAACVASGWAKAQPGSRALRVAAPHPSDRFGHYAVEALNEALRRLGRPRVERVPANQSVARIAREVLAADGAFDLLWGMANAEWEERFAPIAFAMDRGLLGVRVFVVRSDWLDAVDWHTLLMRAPDHLLATLKRLPAGSGIHWPDTAILRANRWRLHTAVDADTLYRMLAAGRVDLFPRSVLEVRAELAERSEQRVHVLPQVAIAYPAVSQVYLRPELRPLAQQLTTTLATMARQGDLKRLFEAHFQADLDELQLKSRKVLWLQNPFLPASAARPQPPLPWTQAPA